jgi:hypothetical protein
MKQLAAATLLGLMSWTGAAAQSCQNSPLTVQLLAQSTIPVGTVTVSNDLTNLFVTFTATGTYTISQVDLAFGAALTDIPQTSSQDPIVSQFPNRRSFCPATTASTFTIPLGTLTPGTPIFIAAHANVAAPCQPSESAWGAGQLFAGSKVCTQGGSEGDDDGGDGGGDHAATLRRSGNEGDGGQGCGGGHGDGSRVGHLVGWDQHGGGDQCGGGHGGDASRVGRINGSDQHGGQQCGGHGDRSRLGHLPGQDNGGDGHDDEGGNCGSAQCGATYFVYVINCGAE